MSETAWGWVIAAIVWISAIAINVAMTHYGAPQQVWLFCQILNWCNP